MTTPFRFDIIGFDLDGTLVDTSGDLAAAVNHALGRAGRPPLTLAAIKPMIGLGAKHMLEQGLAATGGIPASGFKPLYRELLAFYEAHISVHSRLFPGGADLLDALDARGVRYAVVTNKFERFAVQLLADLGLVDRMACVIGADTLGLENAKPSGAGVTEMMRRAGRSRAAFIGDSIYDVQAAADAGVTSVAVRFGFLHQPVETLGADHVIDHFDDLLPLLERIAPR